MGKLKNTGKWLQSALLMLASLLTPVFVWADAPTTTPAIAQDSSRYLARIQLHTQAEIQDLFDRASQLLDEQENYEFGQPIAFVLHGPEVEYFDRANYREYKSLVDKAALLDAYRVIDVRICATYMRLHNIKPESLPPFVEIVPFGPDEERKLRADGYVDF